MATCKECIHYQVCHAVNIDAPCVAFKNKATYAEVKHGHWMYNTDDFTPKMRCSVCGYNKPVAAGIGIKQEPDDYCNKCGAKMNDGLSCIRKTAYVSPADFGSWGDKELQERGGEK